MSAHETGSVEVRREMHKVLIVEDNEMNREMLARRLGRHGFDIRVATDGREAVDAVHQSPPDVVLMDMSLPNIDGWDATRMLKADPSTRMIPVIALTAHALPEDRQRAFDAGCDGFETKPIALPRLLETIRTL